MYVYSAHVYAAHIPGQLTKKASRTAAGRPTTKNKKMAGRQFWRPAEGLNGCTLSPELVMGGRCRSALSANPQTKNLDFRGFDSSRVLSFEG